MTSRGSIATVALTLVLVGCNSENETDMSVSSVPTTTQPTSEPGGHSPETTSEHSSASAPDSVSVESLLQNPPEPETPVRVRGVVRSVFLNEVGTFNVHTMKVVLFGESSQPGEPENSELKCVLAGDPGDSIRCGYEITIDGLFDPHWGNIHGPAVIDAVISDIEAVANTTPPVSASPDFRGHRSMLNDVFQHIEAYSRETGREAISVRCEFPGNYRMTIVGNAIEMDAEFIQDVVDHVKDNPIVSEAWLTGPFTTAEVEMISTMTTLQAVTLEGNPQLNAVDVSSLRNLPHLIELSITNCEAIDDAFATQLGSLSQLNQLNLGGLRERFDLLPKGQPLGLTANGFSALSSLTELRHLTITTDSEIPDESRAQLEGMANLVELRIGAN